MRTFDLLSPRARLAVRAASHTLSIADLSARGLPAALPVSLPNPTTAELESSKGQTVVAFVLEVNRKVLDFGSPLTPENAEDPKRATDTRQDVALDEQQESTLSLQWIFTLRELLSVDSGLFLNRLETAIGSKILLWFIASTPLVSVGDQTQWICLTWIPSELLEVSASETALLRFRIIALENYLVTVLPFEHVSTADSVHSTWPSLRQAIDRVLHLSPSYGVLHENDSQTLPETLFSPTLLETSDPSSSAAHPPLQLLGAITTEAQLEQEQDSSSLRYPGQEPSTASSRPAKQTGYFLRLCANVAETLTPYLSPSTNRSELSTSAAITDSPMQLEPGYAIVLSVDDTSALVKAERVISFETVGQLECALNTTEPRYYLARFFNITALFLFNPGSSVPVLRFMYPFFKKTVRKLLETRFQLTVDRAVDLRKGDPINLAFHVERPLEIDIGKQVLSVSETAVRPRPPTTRPIIDPFLRIKTCATNDPVATSNTTSESVQKKPKSTSYIAIPAHQRFHF